MSDQSKPTLARTVDTRWVMRQPHQPFAPADFADFPPILRTLLLNRGLTTRQEAEIYLQREGSLYDPMLLKDMDKCVARLWQAIDHGEKIAVYGDFDADGVTATSLMISALERFGADAIPYIPNRFDEGYGLNNDAIKTLADQGIDLIITVDCGIRSPDEADLAKTLGVDMIISDHHEPEQRLPDAVAIINQKQPGDAYPEKGLAGVGLAYKIIQAMLLYKGKPVAIADEWLDLVALGSVADVVPLRGENRSIVKAGLKRMQLRQNKGLQALVGVSGIGARQITSADIGFMLGPRLNALGRLGSAMDAVKLLLSKTAEEAVVIAQQLDDINKMRQQLTNEMQTKASMPEFAEITDELIFSTSPDFNMGIVGLAATRLADTYYRPAIVASQGEDVTRGSCRSIEEFHVTHALDECADLLVRHGGHAMAAGFTVTNENLPAFRAKMQEISRRELGHLELVPTFYYDMEVNFDAFKPQRNELGLTMRPNVLEQISMLEPTDKSFNPGALFVTRNLMVRSTRFVGEEKKHLKLVVNDGKTTYDAIGFNKAHLVEHLSGPVDLLYTYEANEWNGNQTLQLNFRDLKPSSQRNDI